MRSIVVLFVVLVFLLLAYGASNNDHSAIAGANIGQTRSIIIDWANPHTVVGARVAVAGVDFDTAKLKRLTIGDLSVAVPAAWREVKLPAGHETGGLAIFMAERGRQPVNAVTFSVASKPNPHGNLLSAGLSVRQVLKGKSAYSNVRCRLVHLDGVTAYVIRFLYRDGGSVFRGVKYVVAKPSIADVVTYEALSKDSASVASAFARSASSLRWLRGPYDLDIPSISVTRTRGNVLEFAIRFRHPIALTKRTGLQVLLDTDQDTSTGIQGAEYALDYDGNRQSPALLKATGRRVHSSTPPTLAFATTPTSATFRINARYVGDTPAFRFWVFASTGQLPDDVAPSDDLDSAIITHAPPMTEWKFPKRTASRQSRTYGRLTYNNP